MIVQYSVQWGDQSLDVLDLSDDHGRDLIVFEPTRGTGGFTQDRGPTLRRLSLRIVWLQRQEEDDAAPAVRRASFLEAVAAAETRLLVHPLDGSFPAKVGRLQETTSNGHTQTTAELVEDRDAGFEVIDAGAGASPRAGADTVQAAADAADTALAEVYLESTAPAESAALAAAWRDRSDERDSVVDARRVQLELEAQSAVLETEKEELELEAPGRYPALIAFLQLQAELRRAAEAATADVATGTFELRLDAPANLLALAASLYGGEQAQLYAQRIRALNRIDTPLSMPAGTVLVMPLAQGARP